MLNAQQRVALALGQMAIQVEQMADEIRARDERLAQPITQEQARALADAGYMPMDEYLRLCSDNAWTV